MSDALRTIQRIASICTARFGDGLLFSSLADSAQMFPGLLARVFTLSGTRGGMLATTGVFLALVGSVLPARGQTARAATRAANVAILITPTSARSARVALAYAEKVPHSRVEKQILQLVALTGGKLTTSIRLEDASLDPRRSRRFPVMTAAEFSMDLERQFQEDEPIILPYLKAFREWQRIDLLWYLPGIGSEPAQRFESPVMSVWRFRDAQMLRYHADIRDNAADLPTPYFAVAREGDGLSSADTAGTVTAAGGTRSTGSSSSLWPMVLIGAGAILSGGAGLYLLVTRWSTRTRMAQTGAHSSPVIRRD